LETNDTGQNKTVLSEWVQRFSKEMLLWAVNRLSQKELAEDLVQDTFIVAYQKMASFEERSQVKTWLFSILKNKIADHYRTTMRIPVVHQSEFDFFDDTSNWKKNQWPTHWETGNEEELLDNPEFKIRLEDCQNKLPESWRLALNLKYLSEKKPTEICQELGITTTNYWQLLHRAKLNLRKCLDNNWFKK